MFKVNTEKWLVNGQVNAYTMFLSFYEIQNFALIHASIFWSFQKCGKQKKGLGYS